MLAGRGTSLGDLEVRVGRSEDQHGADRAVLKNGLETLAKRKLELRGESLATRGARAEGVGDFGAVLQVEQAFSVRRDGHAEADDSHPNSHRAPRDCRPGSSCALSRRAPSRAAGRGGRRRRAAVPSAPKDAASWTPIACDRAPASPAL